MLHLIFKRRCHGACPWCQRPRGARGRRKDYTTASRRDANGRPFGRLLPKAAALGRRVLRVYRLAMQARQVWIKDMTAPE